MKVDLKKWATAPASWITSQGEDLNGVVLSSRIRIARNISDLDFPHHSTPEIQKKILEGLLSIKWSSPNLKTRFSFRLNELTALDRTFLKERQLISREQAEKKGEKGLIVSSGENLSIMVNEEDHIRAASFRPGLDLTESWNQLEQVDVDLSKHTKLAYDPEFGYLTTWPTNVGTGLRASCLLHLPALTSTGKISGIIKKFEGLGLVTRGFYGEGTQALGDLYQISNALTIGHSEEELLKHVEKNVGHLAQMEKKERENIGAKNQKVKVEDKIYRSLGTLKYAQLLSYDEAMHHLSLLRLGALLKVDVPLGLSELTNLFFLIQPAHILIRQGNGQRGDHTQLRADYLRKIFRK